MAIVAKNGGHSIATAERHYLKIFRGARRFSKWTDEGCAPVVAVDYGGTAVCSADRQRDALREFDLRRTNSRAESCARVPVGRRALGGTQGVAGRS
jgi:hypothetical protein